jgi:hypothetical protein
MYYGCTIQLNISTVCMIKVKFDKALDLCIEARNVLHQIHPCAYAEISRWYILVRDIYLAQMDYYFTAFEMSKNSFLSDDRCQINCIKALVDFYEKRSIKQKAIDFRPDQLSSSCGYCTSINETW